MAFSRLFRYNESEDKQHQKGRQLMPQSKRRLVLFCLATGFFWFSLYAYVPFLTVHAQSRGASYSMLGLIAGSYGFVQMILRIPLGIQSDLMNRRKPFILAGMLIALLSALGMWWFDSPVGLLLFRSATGMAAATWVIFSVMFSSWFKPEEAPRAIGILNASLHIGQMAAMFLSGILAEQVGVKPVFLLGAAGGVLALFFGLFIPENRSVHRVPMKLPDLMKVSKEPNLMRICILGAFSQLLVFATTYSFVPLLARNLGATSFELGLLITLFTLGSVFGSLLSGTVLAPRFGERNTLVAGYLLSGIVCMLNPFIGRLGVLYASQIFAGFLFGALFTLLMGLSIRDVENRKRATAMGFFQSIYGIGMFAGPSLVGALSDVMGMTLGFAVVGLFGLVAAFIASRYRQRSAVVHAGETNA